jgi:ParB-like chromosome segregation protein Spo0J
MLLNCGKSHHGALDMGVAALIEIFRTGGSRQPERLPKRRADDGMTEPVRSVISLQSMIPRRANQATEPEPATIPCDMLRIADSPRLAGENREHIQVLAESLDEFPPILVHRPSMQVIDGMHRLAATRLRGRTEIKVQFFDGNEEDIFVISVRTNIAHGLPLSLADRKAAAARIIKAYPEWSNRLIASITGLSPKTIGAIRATSQCATGENTQLHARRGHDGRLRPLSSSAGRRLAAELLEENPTASLRAVARSAGISPGTVRDVRDRLKRGVDPVLGRQEHQNETAVTDPRCPGGLTERLAGIPRPPGADEDRDVPTAAQRGRFDGNDADFRPDPDMAKILQRLSSDPTLRFSETGRSILRHLYHSTDNAIAFGRFIDKVPNHRAATIAELALANAELWRHLAAQLQRRSC